MKRRKKEEKKHTENSNHQSKQKEQHTGDSKEAPKEDPVVELEKELEEAKDKYLRLMAEFENYRKRTAKRQAELLEESEGRAMSKILPVVDDFDRAQEQEEFSEGVGLVHKKLHSILKQIGIEPIESTGKEFNADLHEAVTEIPVEKEEMAGKVVDTIEKGYTYKGKVLRHAKVVVGRKKE